VAVPPEGAMSGLVGQSQRPSPSPGQAPVTSPPAAGGAGAAAGGQGGSTGSGFGMGGGFGFGASAPSSPASPSSGSSGTAGAGSGPSPMTGGAAGEAGQQNQALRLINQILSAPRQTGQGGAFGSQSGTGVATGIGGLAGVASKKDMDGIMVYNEQTNYKKWEFVYDLKKELEAKGMMGGPTNPAGANQNGTGQSPQRSTTGPGSMFGTMGQTPGKQ
jgi:hypothetical protein